MFVVPGSTPEPACCCVVPLSEKEPVKDDEDDDDNDDSVCNIIFLFDEGDLYYSLVLIIQCPYLLSYSINQIGLGIFFRNKMKQISLRQK